MARSAHGEPAAVGRFDLLETHANDERQTSPVSMPSAWATTTAAIEPAAPVKDLATWWRQLGDPLLDQLIADAMASAPDLRTHRPGCARRARASATSPVPSGSPSLGVFGSATRSQPETASSGTDATQTLYAAGFDASWEPSIFGGLRDAAAGAKADAAAAAAMLESTRVSPPPKWHSTTSLCALTSCD